MARDRRIHQSAPTRHEGISTMRMLIIVLAVLVAASGAAAQTNAKFGRGTLTITQGTTKVTLQVEIARDDARAQGLMHRTSMPENSGMIFVFESDAKWGFWMKNTLIPLSIGFIDKNWRLLEVLDMQVAADPANGPFKIYEPSVAYRYALEVNQGFFDRKGIKPGAQLRLVTAK
jgi:uncharacterized membrane protein (UPF0127 family)